MPWLGSDQRVGALRRLSSIFSLSVLGYEEGVVQVPKERHKGRMKSFPLGWATAEKEPNLTCILPVSSLKKEKREGRRKWAMFYIQPLSWVS